MALLQRLASLWRNLFHKSQVEQELTEEVQAYLELLVEMKIKEGLSPAAARRAALIELGGVEQVKEQVRQARMGQTLETIWQDLRYGVRMLLKNPGFTGVAVLTLALGIGANTAIFSVVYAVLLKPLPFPESRQLTVLAGQGAGTTNRSGVAYPDYADWRVRTQSFEDMACYLNTSFNITELERPVEVSGRQVNWNFFQLLGVQPQLGRLFTESDDHLGASPTALISDNLWKDKFGGDPDIVGKTINLDLNQFTVIGVLPPSFEFLRQDDLYLPIGLSLTPTFGLLERGNQFPLYVLARLKRGVTETQARIEMEAVTEQLGLEYPKTNSERRVVVTGLADLLVENVRPVLLVLLGVVGCVLLIACVNVANLMLVRSAGREREIAVRLALGAGRGRIVRQLLTESLLIAALGGIAGWLVGAWGINSMTALVPQDLLRLDQVRLNLPVLLFTLGASLLTGLLFGLLPALHASRTNLNTTLKEGGRSGTGSAWARARQGLLVAEVGLALVLLVGAGLMLRTLQQLTHVDPGFNAENLLTTQFSLSGKSDNEEQRLAFFRECLTRIEVLPGVRSAAFVMSLPIAGSNWNSPFIVADQTLPMPDQAPSAAFTPVSARYFETMEIQLRSGRGFCEAEMSDSPPVAVINESLARRVWPDENPVGKRLKQGRDAKSQSVWREVVGVVADVKLNGVDRETPLQIYLPLAQRNSSGVKLVVRTTGNPLAAAATVEQTIHSLDKDLPVTQSSMEQLMGNAIAQQRLTLILMGSFALLALILAGVGIYGVMSYVVKQRTREIGIRLALGAQTTDVLKVVISQGMLMVGVGVFSGIAVALMLTKLLTSFSSLLYGVKATDPMTFVLVALLLVGVALLACYIPARRATKVDPLVALRCE
jgi:putative ABC transport system permease protein